MVTERSVLVRLRANADPFIREMHRARQSVRGLRDDIDTSNKRSAWLVQGLTAIGPAAVAAGAAAIPVLVGLATQATIGAAAVGTVALAFNGVGDALKALNKYQLEPTTKNLEKLRQSMAALGPEGAEFALVLDEAAAKLSVLSRDARSGMFPGFEAAIAGVLDRLPELRRVVIELSRGVGQLGRDFGTSLSGGGFDDFFNWLQSDAQRILVETGRTIGNFFKGFAELMISFQPLTRTFSSGLLEMSRGFAAWAAGLDETSGFQSFMAYVNDIGPQVLDMLGSFSTALIEISKAAAPVGQILVPALTMLADVISAIADTPAGSFLILGAAITALYGRMAALAGGGFFRLLTGGIRDSGKAAKAAVPSLRQWGTALAYVAHSNQALAIGMASQSKAAQAASKRAIEARNAVSAFGKAVLPAAAGAGLLAVALSPIPQKMGLTNTAMGAMLGLIVGPWGAAVGAGIGLAADFAAATNHYADAQERANEAIKSGNAEQIKAAIEEQKKILAGALDSDEVTGAGDLFSDVWRGLSGGGSSEVKKRAIEQIADLEDALSGVNKAASRLARQRRVEQWARGTGDAFLKLSADIEKPELSLRKLMARMREQGRVAARMGTNLRRALDNGADPTALQKLVEDLGPQAALVLEQLADGGVGAARRFNRAWSTTDSQLSKLEESIYAVGTAVAQLPDGTVIRLSVDGAKAREDIERFKAQVASIKDRTVKLNIISNYIGGQNKRDAGEAGPGAGQLYTGGYTGHGGKYEPAGIVHRGEVVIPQERVRRDKPFLMSRYGDLPGMSHLRGMATGGLAGAVDAPRIVATGAPAVGTRETREAAQALKGLAREAKQSTASLAKLRNRRSALLGQRSDLMGSVSDGLRSDLWGGGEWGEGGDPLSILRGDIRNARAFRAGAIQLRNKGVTGAALAEILRDGDLGRVQQMSSMSRAQLAEYRELFGARDVAIRGGARAAGNTTYGAALDRINRQIAGLQRAVDRNGRRASDDQDKNRRQQRGAQARAGRRRNRGVV